MKNELDIHDLRLIIRNLIAFIVVEGKEFVSDHQKTEYVSRYVQLLIKNVHMIDEKDKNSIVEDIADDITTYLK